MSSLQGLLRMEMPFWTKSKLVHHFSPHDWSFCCSICIALIVIESRFFVRCFISLIIHHFRTSAVWCHESFLLCHLYYLSSLGLVWLSSLTFKVVVVHNYWGNVFDVVCFSFLGLGIVSWWKVSDLPALISIRPHWGPSWPPSWGWSATASSWSPTCSPTPLRLLQSTMSSWTQLLLWRQFFGPSIASLAGGILSEGLPSLTACPFITQLPRGPGFESLSWGLVYSFSFILLIILHV